jgi:transposase InsO family protein
MPKTRIQRLHAKLHKLYYRDGGYQGLRALYELVRESGFAAASMEEVGEWFYEQPINQSHRKIAPMARRLYPHFNITEPNRTHQVDIMYVTDDNGYKYVLGLIDCASRYKAARPLKSKTSEEAAAAIKSIYKEGPLVWPKEMMMDQGTEFKGVTTDLLKKHNVRIIRSDPLHHRSQAFVESFNRDLARRLYKRMQQKGPENGEWVDALQTTVTAMNNETTKMIDKKPVKAIKLKNVAQLQYDPDQLKAVNAKVLELGTFVRYLLEKDDTGDGERRQTDIVWSPEVYEVSGIFPADNQPTMYSIAGPIWKDMPMKDYLKIKNMRHRYTSLNLQVLKKLPDNTTED